MKHFIYTCLTLLFNWSLCAQGLITGQVVSQDKAAIPFATIVVYKTGSAAVGTVSNSEGRFIISGLQNGVYKVAVSLTGFDSYEKEFVLGNLNKTLDFGTILLREKSLTMDRMTVVGQRFTASANELDRKSFSVSEMLTGANGSVLDAMKQLPGITIDQEGKVQLRGSDKVTVLIDGKQSALTGFGSQKGLETIPASQIDYIEIINNPSAKYDAAGMAGIVNIIFRQQEKIGLNGDVGFSLGLGQLSRRKSDLPTGMPSYARNPKYTPSLNLNYKTKQLNMFLQSFWINQKRLPNNEFSTRHYPNGDMVESQVAENRSQDHYNLKMGFDWYVADNQTLTLFGLYDYEWHIDTTKVWYFENKDYLSPIRKYGFYESEGTGFANVTLQHKLRFVQPGHELKSQYLFTKGWEDETYNLHQEATVQFPDIDGDQTHVLAPEYIHQLSSDYVRPLSFGRLESGLQARFRKMPITYTMKRAQGNTALLFDYGDWSKWSEDLAAGYINFVSELKRWDIEAGLRGEYTNVTYKFAPNQYFKNDRYDYSKLFPNTRITFKADQNNDVSLFWNKRIDRPGEDILRIFPKYDDPELLKIGNPKLRPQLTDSVELAYRLKWRGGSFSAATYYKYISNYYTRIYVQDPTHKNITIKGYSNIPEATNAGVELNFDQEITKSWKANLSGNVYRNSIFGYTGEIDFPTPVKYIIDTQRDNPWFLKANNLFAISPRVRCEVGGSYFSNKAIAQGRELSRWGLNFGVRTSWLNNKLEVTLSANDLFNRMGIRQQVSQGGGYFTYYQNFYETQLISLGAKYKF